MKVEALCTLHSVLCALPLMQAPFARDNKWVEQPVELETRAFKVRETLPKPTVQTNLYDWAQFVCGDKSVLANGYDAALNWKWQSGWGNIALYAGTSRTAKPGQELVVKLSLRIPSAKKPLDPWTGPWPDDYMEHSASKVTWRRGYTTDAGARGELCYSLASVAPGRLAMEWDFGDEAAPQVEMRMQFMQSVTNILFGVGSSNYVFSTKDEMHKFSDTVYTRYHSQPVESNLVVHVNRNDEARHFELEFVEGAPPKITWEDGLRNVGATNEYRVCSPFWRMSKRGRAIINLGKSTQPAQGKRPKVGGIDFWQEDALCVVAARSGGNLLANGSFEQGLSFWSFSHGGTSWNTVATNGIGACEQVVSPGHESPRALQCNRPESLSSVPLALTPNAPHRLTFWYRGPKGSSISLFVSPAQRYGKVTYAPKTRNHYFPNGEEWQRGEINFTPVTGDARVSLTGKGGVQIDDLCVTAAGEEAVPTAPIVADLTTDEFKAGAPLNLEWHLAWRKLSPAKMKIRIKNFYGEVVLNESRDLAPGEERVQAALSNAAGTGVFIVETGFKQDGETWRGDAQRLLILNPLAGTHPLDKFFVQFPYYESSSRAPDVARRMVQLGIGSTTWQQNFRFTNGTAIAKLARDFNIVDRLHCLSSELAHRFPERFGWRKVGMNSLTNATPEDLEFVEREAFKAGSECDAGDVYWALWNEEEAACPMLRDALKPTTSEDERNATFDRYFKLQYAAWKGLNKAFTARGLKLMYAPSHGPCNFNPDGNHRPLMDNFLAAAARANFRYTFIATHMYHAIDGSILGPGDRDANADALYAMLARYNLDDVPIMFSEGFNMLPFYIREWGATGWADDYYGEPPSQSGSAREVLQAATMARLYIMDLKRWPRVMTSHTWQHRLTFDARLAPYMWNMVPNTLGHLLPDPRFVGQVTREGWRAYVFQQGDHAVAAFWCCDNDVEWGLKAAPALRVTLPPNCKFYDLMGNERSHSAAALPLTIAPLFIVHPDAKALLAAFEQIKE